MGNGWPSILYFRSDHCAPCITQARFLQELQAEFGDRVAVEKVDVELESQRARSYGVFTLPTTLIVDRTGTVRQANYGLTDARTLAGQLQRLESLTSDVAGGQARGSAGKEGALGQQTPTKSPSTC